MDPIPVPFLRSEHAAPMSPALAVALRDADLGVHRGVVELAAPSPHWARAFTGLVDALTPTRPADALALEHIGSTSVPGLPAKAILDVAIGQRPGSDPQPLHWWLMRAGHLYRGEAGPDRPDRIYALELEPGVRLVNVHVLDHGGEQWRRYLAFRDHLRTHPVERDAYGELKLRLAVEHPEDRLAYVRAKGSFITTRDTGVSGGDIGVHEG